MKDDKYKPASERQRRQALRLGVTLLPSDTVHSACQKINKAVNPKGARREH